MTTPSSTTVTTAATPAVTTADTPAADPTQGVPVLAVTDAALATVLEVRASEDDPGSMALKVAITGANMTEYAYALELAPIADAQDGDAVYTQGDRGELTVIIPADSISRMFGSTLDVPSSSNGGLVIRNPNPPDPLAGLDLDLTGELPEKVQAVLDQAINPALAAHGGFARLVGIEDNGPDDKKVFVMMGGGCQGCAASAITLQDGIRSMLLEALPEITEVLDATDHSAGENPFYS
jgi:Fe/S biogenesis protein NfuA